MSQQAITIVSVVSVVKGRKLADVEFLAIKEFDGKLFTETSSEFTTIGTKITRIVPNLKTFFLHKSKLIIAGGGDQAYTGEIIIKCQVKFDGVIIDNFSFGGFQEQVGGEGTGWGMSGVMPETTVMGKSMVGDGIKTVTIEVVEITGVNVSGFLTLSGWEEDTGTSPQIPST